MKNKKNPELKEGDRIILINMPGENLFAGTKGKVVKYVKVPSFGTNNDYQWLVDWYDEDGDKISSLALLPESDSWILDPEFNKNDLNEAKITDIDALIKKAEWLKLFKRTDLRYILDYLEAIRQSGIVNMFQSGQFLGQTSNFMRKYFDLYELQHELDENKEEIIEKIIEMSDKVRDIMIRSAVMDLDRNNREITTNSAQNRLKRLGTEVVKEYMTQNR
jgi:hypothetical protein